MNRRVLDWMAIPVTLAVFVAGSLFAWDWWQDRHRFDSASWRANGNCRNLVRKKMVGDLREHHLKEGLTFAEVRALLGKPDNSWTDDRRGRWRGQWWGYLTGPSVIDCFVFDLQFLDGRFVRSVEGEN